MTTDLNGVEFLNTTEVAALANVTSERVWQWATRGILPAFRRGGRQKLWFRRDDVQAFLTMKPVQVKAEAVAKRTKGERAKAAAGSSKRVAAWARGER